MNSLDYTSLIILTILGIFLIIFAYLYSSILIKNKKLQKEIDHLNIASVALYSKISELMEQNEEKSIEQTDGFLKFISDSRDWAFSYIDNVQDVILEIAMSRHKGGPELELAINKLINLLPEENKA